MMGDENPFERRAKEREVEQREKASETAQVQKLAGQTQRISMYAQEYAAARGRTAIEWDVRGPVITATSHSGSVFKVTVLDTDSYRIQSGESHTAEGDMDRLADEFHGWLDENG
jgi:hypothetical protein